MSKKKNKRPLIIGLTGGIATGKSTVAKMIRKMRIPVICTDEIAHALTKKASPVLKEILKQFSPLVFNADKSLNRPALAKIVFSNPKQQKILEKILHPKIKREVKKQIVHFITGVAKLASLTRGKPRDSKIIVIDVPLLFEARWDKICDFTLCVTAPQKLQIERLKKYRNLTRKEALARIKAQMPLKEKVKRADFVIENGLTLKALKNHVTKMTQQIKSL